MTNQSTRLNRTERRQLRFTTINRNSSSHVTAPLLAISSLLALNEWNSERSWIRQQTHGLRRSLVYTWWCPLRTLFGHTALPHAPEFGKLDEVRYGVSEARREERRVDGRLSRLPASQQRLKPFVPEDRVQAEPVLDDVGAVVAAGVRAGRRQESGLIQCWRKRRGVVVKLLGDLAVKPHLTVGETSSNDIGLTTSTTAAAADVQTDSAVDTGRRVTAVGAVVTAPHAADTRHWWRTGQWFAAPPPAARHCLPLVWLAVGWSRRRIPHRHVDGRVIDGKTVHDFHGGVAETRGKRVFAAVRHVVRIVSAHDPTHRQRGHRNDSPRCRDDHAGRSSQRRWSCVFRLCLIVRMRPLVLPYVCTHTTYIQSPGQMTTTTDNVKLYHWRRQTTDKRTQHPDYMQSAKKTISTWNPTYNRVYNDIRNILDYCSLAAIMNTFISQKQQTIIAGKTDIYKERRTQTSETTIDKYCKYSHKNRSKLYQ